MAQRAEKKRSKLSNSTKQTVGTFASSSTSYDPTLASLFGSSLGPIKKPSEGHTQPKSRGDEALSNGIRNLSREKTLGSGPPLGKQTFGKPNVNPNLEDRIEDAVPKQLPQRSSKKRRKDADDSLEGRYMQKLVREEVREDFNRKKRRLDKALLRDGSIEGKTGPKVESRSDSIEPPNGDDNVSLPTDVPQHESLGQGASDNDLKKASRTVFLGNVSNTAIKSKSGKRVLLDHLTSFPATSPKQDTSYKIESLRFRSTAYSSSAVPKKAAFAKKELMDSTTKSTNAYAVYTTELAAREAVKALNGTVVLDRHLRVDSVAHPTKTDHRRCVFIGNLGFVDDESAMNDADENADGKRPRRGKDPADLEEGLWMQFGKAGAIESVRVPRDKSTRVGKGFAYVQFKDPNGVEKALLFNGKKFPPMLPRILRVTRAKHIQKTTGRKGFEKRSAKTDKPDKGLGAYSPKIPSEIQSSSGRAGKLLGRAGASQFRSHGSSRPPLKGISKTPESIVFEGHRASSKHGRGTLRLGGSGKKQGKPRTRSSRRGAAFKASGKQK